MMNYGLNTETKYTGKANEQLAKGEELGKA
jgi:hypothetical protein